MAENKTLDLVAWATAQQKKLGVFMIRTMLDTNADSMKMATTLKNAGGAYEVKTVVKKIK